MQKFCRRNTLFVVLIIGGLIYSQSVFSSNNQICFKKGCINVEVAQRFEELRRGLQSRSFLDHKSGMLFIFQDSGWHAFWMKDTLIPLDIIWLDSSQRVVHVAYNVPPCKIDPCPTYTSQNPAQFVLEINAGLAHLWNIQIGDKAEIKLVH